VSAVLHAERVRYRYPGAHADVLCDASLAVERGEIVLLAGSSGSGKSTLLRALCGLVPHFHGGRFGGTVVVDGLDTRSARPAETCARAGILFQEAETQSVYADVLRDVAFGLRTRGAPAGGIADAARRALAAVGAAHLEGRSVESLSGGERQRVALAGVVAPAPPVLLLDEPTSQLDDAGAEALAATLRGLAASGVAIVVAEHRVDRLAHVATRIVAVADGAVGPYAPPAALGSAVAGAPGPVVLRARGLAGRRGEREVLRGLDLAVRAGSVVAVHGPNGAGKSTLLRLLAGLDRPAAGTIELAGADVTAVPAERRFPALATVVQDPGRHLLCERVADEVALGLGPDAAPRVGRALHDLDLDGFADRHPRDLSVGERERVAVAAALAAAPRVLLLDEPTRGVDPVRRAALAQLLRRHAAAGGAAVVATHDAGFAAAACDEHHRLDDGSLVLLHDPGLVVA
jgi:energy-coupling factor transport system ATP-binding protein